MSDELSAKNWRLARVGEPSGGWATGARDDEGEFDISEVFTGAMAEQEARARAKETRELYPRSGCFALPVVWKEKDKRP